VVKCIDCIRRITWWKYFLNGGRCDYCSEKEEKRKKEDAAKILEEEHWQVRYETAWSLLRNLSTGIARPEKDEGFWSKFEELADEEDRIEVAEKSADADFSLGFYDDSYPYVFKIAKTVLENVEVRIEKEKIKKRAHSRKIREKAEKQLYGKVKHKRAAINPEVQKSILEKFNNECRVYCLRGDGRSTYTP